MKNVIKLLAKASEGRMAAQVFASFARVSATALGCGMREAEYLEEAKRLTAKDLTLFADALAHLVEAMEAEPYTDLLGTIYMELLGKHASFGGEFHTPAEICELVSSMVMDEQIPMDHHGLIHIAEPACGAGAQILALGKRMADRKSILRVQAIDISAVACDLCFINTTLWGIPTVVIHGNALSCEQWSAWANFPMIQVAPITSKRMMTMTATYPPKPTASAQLSLL
jgi:type I restriction-modification system DNA methylase subunit